MLNQKVHDNYIIYNRHIIGKGGFGKVYLALDRHRKKLIAVKVEEKTANSLLKKEYGFINFLKEQAMKESKNNHGILNPLCVLEDHKYYYMFTELYGPNLDTIHQHCGRKFSTATTIEIAKQMLNAIRFCHENGIIHRDIKLANFMIDFCNPHKYIHLCDFGLSKKYMVNGQHIPYQIGVIKVGSMRYMSRYTHRGIQSSCRDDMYSLAYAVIYMVTGNLPWTDDILKGKDKNVINNMLYSLKTPTENLVITKGIECSEFRALITSYMDYLDTLEFGSVVNYDLLSQQLQTVNTQFDRWDWLHE